MNSKIKLDINAHGKPFISIQESTSNEDLRDKLLDQMMDNTGSFRVKKLGDSIYKGASGGFIEYELQPVKHDDMYGLYVEHSDGLEYGITITIEKNMTRQMVMDMSSELLNVISKYIKETISVSNPHYFTDSGCLQSPVE